MPGLDATVFTNVTRPGYVYSVCICIFVYSCKCVCVCTGVMGKCQDCACVSLLSLSFYPHHTMLDHHLKQALAMFTQLAVHSFICYLYYYCIRPHPSS